MVYDNMRVALAKYVGRHEKEPTVALLQLRGHYGFSHRFCNAYRGNEKGHVERSVEYIRRKAFGLKYQFSDISEAESWLFCWSPGWNIGSKGGLNDPYILIKPILFSLGIPSVNADILQSNSSFFLLFSFTLTPHLQKLIIDKNLNFNQIKLSKKYFS